VRHNEEGGTHGHRHGSGGTLCMFLQGGRGRGLKDEGGEGRKGQTHQL